MIRVLIIEDSPTVRMALRSVLEAADGITVVGEAENGAAGVRLATELRPDLITMDIHMPVLDGVEATRQIMVEAPTPILIVSASSDDGEVSRAFEAVEAGALSLVDKPQDPHDPAFDSQARQLVRTVKALADLKVVRRRATQPKRKPRARTRTDGAGRIVGILASTGGPTALRSLLHFLAPDFGAPILVVQHIAHGFTEALARWLSTGTSLRVEVARHGARITPNTVYVAPDGCHLGVGPRSRIALSDTPPVDGFRPSGTHLFRSLGEHWGSRALCVVLTGMGHDGVAGLESVRRAGGTVVVQDRETSVVFGMNGAAAAAGLADAVLPLRAIPDELTRRVRGVT